MTKDKKSFDLSYVATAGCATKKSLTTGQRAYLDAWQATQTALLDYFNAVQAGRVTTKKSNTCDAATQFLGRMRANLTRNDRVVACFKEAYSAILIND